MKPVDVKTGLAEHVLDTKDVCLSRSRTSVMMLSCISVISVDLDGMSSNTGTDMTDAE